VGLAAWSRRQGICDAVCRCTPVEQPPGPSTCCNPGLRGTGARLLRLRESLSRLGPAPILSLMRRQPIDPVFAAEPEPPVRACEHPGCPGGGEFRAPKSRLELDRYYWFCLEHVRAYNSAWNYYAGMNDPRSRPRSATTPYGSGRAGSSANGTRRVTPSG